MPAPPARGLGAPAAVGGRPRGPRRGGRRSRPRGGLRRQPRARTLRPPAAPRAPQRRVVVAALIRGRGEAAAQCCPGDPRRSPDESESSPQTRGGGGLGHKVRAGGEGRGACLAFALLYERPPRAPVVLLPSIYLGFATVLVAVSPPPPPPPPPGQVLSGASARLPPPAPSCPPGWKRERHRKLLPARVQPRRLPLSLSPHWLAGGPAIAAGAAVARKDRARLCRWEADYKRWLGSEQAGDRHG